MRLREMTANCIMGVFKTVLMAAKTLPHTRKSSIGKVDLSREREWILQHGHLYVGEWVVLGDGALVGHSADGSEIGAMVEKARAEGIEAPYVKFVREGSEPIWMGWL
jgi:hypothetical protein